MKLREIAHSRAGDKGNISTLSVIPFDESDYPFLKSTLTAELVRQHLSGVVQGRVERFDVPGICSLNFVCYESLGGGVTRSLALDKHGKSLSGHLLDLELNNYEKFKRD